MARSGVYFALIVSLAALLTSAVAVAANPSERYAVLIVGTGGCTPPPGGLACCATPFDSISCDSACVPPSEAWFFYDTVLMQELLIDYYCFKPENVFVLYGNGYGCDPNACPRYGGTGCDTIPVQERQFWGPAQYDTLRVLLHGLAYGDSERNIPRVDSNDMLFVWTFDHGCRDSPQGYEKHAYLGLGWGRYPGGLPDSARDVRDDTLGLWFAPIVCDARIVVMQQCFGGGFYEDLAGPNAIFISAAGFSQGDLSVSSCADDKPPFDGADTIENEVCNSLGGHAIHGEMDYHFMNALRGVTVQGNPIDADENGDGWVSIEEAYNFTYDRDSMKPPGQDSLPYSGGGADLSLYGRIHGGSIRLCEDTTFWSGNVTLRGDVVLPAGKVLVVRPGTTIKCDSLDNHGSGADTANVEIIIKGTLLAEGTSQNPIKFTSSADPAPGQIGENAPDDTWRGIRFRPGSSGTLQHCTIRRAYYAVDCDSANPTIEYSSICDNQIAGIRCSGTAAPTIAEGDSIARSYRGILCTGHTAPTIQEGVVVDTCNIGILAQGYSTPAIRDCRVKRCHTGISVTAHSAPRVGSGCDIFQNWQEGILLDSNGNNGISIDSSSVRDNYSYGIRVEGSTSATIFHSAIYGNNEGVASFEDAACLVGSASPEEAGYNNIYDNDDYDIRNSTTSGDTLKAENCWWGSSSPDTSKMCGVVDYQPFLTSQVQLALLNPRGPAVPSTKAVATLGRIYPLPTGQITQITYSVGNPGAHVRLSIVNVLGQVVSTLSDKWKSPGQYTVSWDCRNGTGEVVEPGVFFCVLENDNGPVQAAKLIVVGDNKLR